MLKIEPITAFSDNYIWLLHDATEAWVVDPGDAGAVLTALEAIGKPLRGILVTHHHFDHTGGIADLVALYQPKVFGPDNPAIDHIDQRLQQGDQLDVLGLSLEILEVPGHTLDHIAYFARDQQPVPLLFCGDTLFAGGCGRVFEGTPSMMHASLQRLAALPDNTRIYCAHEYTLANLAFAAAVEPGNTAIADRIEREQTRRRQNQPTVPSILSEELLTNPFLRCDQRNVIRSAERHAGKTLSGTDEVFAQIRDWKNNY
jgi:hydroxyacylglutathione hydrolase